ncbi:MAG: hypothetical protein JXP34_04760 [Planctomycetes bacterium]|nr:hypothetical protein [Planctomycetota bacterium]
MVRINPRIRRSSITMGVLLAFATLSSARGENRVDIGSVEGRPGEIVQLPVLLTQAEALLQVDVSWAVDPTVLVPIPPSIEGTVSGALPADLFTHHVVQDGWARAVIRMDAHGAHDNLLPPGEEQLILWIRFRIRSGADPGPTVVHGHNTTEVSGGTILITPSAKVLPIVIRDGAVIVLPPQGPRPPEISRCVQVVKRVYLEWTNLEGYDAISVERDGESIATLPGDSVAWSDPLPPVGLHRYGLAGVRSGAPSVAAACEVVVGEAKVESVRNLTCVVDEASVGLSWIITDVYEGIIVRVDGADLATLAGDATAYSARLPSGEPTLFEVIGIREGFPSPSARCVVNGSFLLRAGDVRAQAGEKGVRIPIYATTMEPLQGSSYCIALPDPWIAGPGYTLEGSLLETIEPELFQPTNLGDRIRLGIYHDVFPPLGPTLVPPAIEAPLFSVLVDVPATAKNGEIIPVTFGICGSPPVWSTFVVLRPGLSCASINPTCIPGSLVVGDTGVASVAHLRADRIAGAKGDENLRLSWQNSERFDRITIEMNGALAAELPGDASSFLAAALPNETYHFRVTAFRDDRPSFPESLTVSMLPGYMVFRRGDVDADGWVNLGDAIRILGYLFAMGAPPTCLDAADTDDSGALDLGDPIFLLNYLYCGGRRPPCPGPYAEGFDPTPDELLCP